MSPATADGFGAYLATRYAAATARHYAYLVERYVSAVGGEAIARAARYAEVVAYLGAGRERGASSAALAVHLAALKAYYAYLLDVGVREDHPCRRVSLRARRERGVRVDELYTADQLARFYESIPTGGAAGRHAARTRVAVSLVMYQALTTGELVALRVSDVELHGGYVDVAGDGRTQPRRLPLRAQQVLLIDGYVRREREWYAGFRSPELPAARELLLSMRGTRLARASVADAINAGRSAGERLVPSRMRHSVIADLLNRGHDVRIVQAFAGHATPTTTERYEAGGVDALAEAIARCHPLGDVSRDRRQHNYDD